MIKIMKNFKFVFIFHLLALIVLAGCEKSGPQGEGNEIEVPQPIPHSAAIEGGNVNFPSGGVLSVGFSDHPSGCDISKIADNDFATNYVTAHDRVDIVFVADDEFAVTRYALVSAAENPEADPSAWTLYASADGKGWVVIDSRSNVDFSERGLRKDFLVDNKKSYRYYKLAVTSTRGGEAFHLADYFLISKVPLDIDDLMGKASGWSTSSKTPMGKHFENRKTATADELAWLKDAGKNPEVVAAGNNINGKWETCAFELYPSGIPVPSDVNQRSIGNCCACALWAALAYSRPEYIKSIIEPVANGYEVTMFDPEGNPVAVGVSRTFICNNGNIQQCAGKKNVATWSTVLEKALMKWQSVYRCNYPIGGIGTEHVAPLYTGEGNSFAFSPGALTAVELAKAVNVGLRMGYLIVGGFKEKDVVCDDPFKTVTAHAFTAMEPMNEKALFAMRNPWGKAAGSPDGKEDGVMHIYDDGRIPPMVDLRVIYGGRSDAYLKDELK